MTNDTHSSAIQHTGLQDGEIQQKQDEEKENQDTFNITDVKEGEETRSRPATWVEASLGIRKRRPVRYPVIIGDDSMFKTPDDLRNFLEVSDTPAVSKVAKATDRWGGSAFPQPDGSARCQPSVVHHLRDQHDTILQPRGGHGG